MSVLQPIKSHKSIAKFLMSLSIGIPLIALGFSSNAIAVTHPDKGYCPKDIRGGILINHHENEIDAIDICRKNKDPFNRGINNKTGQ